MIQTVIGINSAMMRSSGRKRKQMKDYKKDLQEVIAQVEAAKNRLAELSVEMDEDDLETGGVDAMIDPDCKDKDLLALVTYSFQSYVNPGIRIPAEVSVLNHITDETLEAAPTEKDVYPESNRSGIFDSNNRRGMGGIPEIRQRI